jgi:hypothetical protein
MSVTNTPAVLYEAALRTRAVAASQPRRYYPRLQSIGDAKNANPTADLMDAAYAFDQDFEMLAANFPPAKRNTPSNATNTGVAIFAGLQDSNAILTKISTPSNTMGGKVKFTASFHIVPASWDDFITQSVTFPGITNFAFVGGVRDSKAENVLTRQHRDYFVIDPDGVLATAGVLDSGGNAITRVASKGAIPTLPRKIFGFTTDGGATKLVVSEVNSLVKAGGISSGSLYYYETVPNTETYQAWIAVAAAFNTALSSGGNAWDSTHPPAWDGNAAPPTTCGQWQFADSRLEPYAGNIVCRLTEFVLAQ